MMIRNKFSAASCKYKYTDKSRSIAFYLSSSDVISAEPTAHEPPLDNSAAMMAEEYLSSGGSDHHSEPVRAPASSMVLTPVSEEEVSGVIRIHAKYCVMYVNGMSVWLFKCCIGIF
ncbi:hypothetical protein J6590_077173 [Homalodisca vitripennis]|nr:hypothetical protein J6590_077173 [Homalodisca vitripennis]